MIFDLRFAALELQAAGEGSIPPELFASPAFRAIAFHEAAMNRPTLDEEGFRRYLAAAAAGEEDCWGLSALFRRRTKLEYIFSLLEQEQALISEVMEKWLSVFTTAPLAPGLTCVPYVGTYDGGFKLEWDSETIYLNIPAISCREALYETLAHESYHARQRSPHARERIRRLEHSDDYLGGVLYFTFEEGIAEFIGNNGFTTTKYPVLPLRHPDEGTCHLKALLERYHSRKISGPELYRHFLATDCRYTGGVSVAAAVWASLGREGLDLWSVHCDQKAFYEAFRATPAGEDWPDFRL